MTKNNLTKKENNKPNQKPERVYLDFASQTVPSKKVISEMKKVEDIYLDNKTLMKKFKGCCIEIIDTFCEYGEKNRKELMVI